MYSSGMTSTRNNRWNIGGYGSGKIGCPPTPHEGDIEAKDDVGDRHAGQPGRAVDQRRH